MTQVTIEQATAADAALLGNLMELYIHDLSAMFPHVKLGSDGRFGYPELSTFLDGSGRSAFLIRDESTLAGFALARQGSPASDDPNVLDVAEFFVLKQFRSRGVGRAAATLLWNQLRGSWTVRASSKNPKAIEFWRSAISDYTRGKALELERTEGPKQWVVFAFDNTLDPLSRA